MNIEDRLRASLSGLDDYEPSPDLHDHIVESIEDDREHRRRVRGSLLIAVAAVVFVGVYFAIFARVESGGLVMDWRALEVLVAAVMVALVGIMGPIISRFGRAYVRDVFRASSDTPDRFLRLLDTAYYLVFGGYVLVTVSFRPEVRWAISGAVAQLEDAGWRIGGLLLLMGVLHAATIAVLPLIGLLFTSAQRRARGLGRPTAGPARVADLVATAAVWVMAAGAIALGFFVALLAVLGAVGG